MTSKILTLNCTYKVKVTDKTIKFENICEQLKEKIACMLASKQFDDQLHIIAEEEKATITEINEPKVELMFILFTTFYHAPELPTKMFKKYVDNNLMKVETDSFVAKMTKRRVY